MAKASAEEIERVVKELGFKDADELKSKLQDDNLTLAQVLDRQFEWGRKFSAAVLGLVLLAFIVIGTAMALTWR